LREVDFHALPFGTDVLLAARPVVYGLDLETRTPASLAPRQALVVADPQGDLPASRTEAAAVISGLRRQRPPWKVEQLAGQDAASAALQSRFGRVSLLHYAGHGTFAGFGGWESALPLAGETRLLPGDLLALDRVPDRVVLSGCDTGKSNAAAPVEGLGLAQAFLLAGARSVLATTRPVGDHNAAEILTAFYRSWDGASDPASALRQALLLQRRHSPGSDWAGFRLFEP
jgi:CHAT domain-containing protein